MLELATLMMSNFESCNIFERGSNRLNGVIFHNGSVGSWLMYKDGNTLWIRTGRDTSEWNIFVQQAKELGYQVRFEHERRRLVS